MEQSENTSYTVEEVNFYLYCGQGLGSSPVKHPHKSKNKLTKTNNVIGKNKPRK